MRKPRGMVAGRTRDEADRSQAFKGEGASVTGADTLFIDGSGTDGRRLPLRIPVALAVRCRSDTPLNDRST